MKIFDAGKKNLHEKGSHRIRFSHAAEAGIIIALFFASILFMVYVYHKVFQPLNLIEDNHVDFAGFSGYGIIDNYHPEKDTLEKLAEEKEKREEKKEDTSDITRLMDSISCSFDHTDHLTNGETITYGCSYDQAAAIKAGYSLHKIKRSFTVTGLKSIQTIDPFDEISFYLDQNNRLETAVSDKLAGIPLSFIYDFQSASLVRVTLNYDTDEAARHGWRFSTNEKDISLQASQILFTGDDLENISAKTRGDITKSAWNLPLEDIIDQSCALLPEHTDITDRPVLERWYIDSNGKLAVVCLLAYRNEQGMHYEEVIFHYEMDVILSADKWNIHLIDQSGFTVKTIKPQEYRQRIYLK